MDPVSGKLRPDHVRVAVGLLLEHRDDHLSDPKHVVAAVVRDRARVVGRRPNERHPLHEELVKIRREDRQELHALEKRRPLVERLLKHAPVELQPTRVAIDPRATRELLG
jgi:hypothetical protein